MERSEAKRQWKNSLDIWWQFRWYRFGVFRTWIAERKNRGPDVEAAFNG